MPTYVALLRGVNVGKAKRVPMAELRDVLAGLGCTRRHDVAEQRQRRLQVRLPGRLRHAPQQSPARSPIDSGSMFPSS